MNESARSFPFLINGALRHTKFGRIEPLLERISGLKQLQSAYDTFPDGLSADEFLASALDWLDVHPQCNTQELANIPVGQGTIVVANHPHGALDGLVLLSLLKQVRRDIRVLANGLLARVPELASLFIGVDPFGGQGAELRNRRPLRDAIRWVEVGGLLVVFPAGEVSHLQPRRRSITDPDWHSAVARIVQRTRAMVVPAYIPGHNSTLFQLAGLIHPRLRTACRFQKTAALNVRSRLHYSSGGVGSIRQRRAAAGHQRTQGGLSATGRSMRHRWPSRRGSESARIDLRCPTSH